MTALDGQVVSPLPDGGLALSSGALVEDGARVGLLLVDGLFRFDAVPQADTLRVVVRNLSRGECEWHQHEAPGNPGAFAFTIEVDGRTAEVQVLAEPLGAHGRWQLTASGRVSAPRLAA